MSVESPNNNDSSIEKLVEREPVKGSPYWIIGNEETGYRLTFGKWSMSEIMKTKEEVENHLEEEMINIILTTILTVIDAKEAKIIGNQ